MRRTWLGIIIIVIGLGFLLDQANVISFIDILSHWWPLIFIVIGFLQLVTQAQSATLTGPLFIMIGAILLLNEWTDSQIFLYLWPLVIIYIGIIIIFYRPKHNKNVNKDNMLDSISLFSGAEIKSQSNPFQGGNILAVFGGTDIDLRDAVIVDEEITIEITTVFGGVSLKVPDNVQVEVSGIPIFGGFEDKTRHVNKENTHQPIIYLKCVSIFGGVEVTD